MTDRQTLENAAAAAGISGPYVENQRTLTDAGWQRFTGIMTDSQTCWNPLADDGDALRLAVKLRLEVDIYQDGRGVCVGTTTNEDPFGVELADELAADHNGDSCAATRRAITRAAAAMAKG